MSFKLISYRISPLIQSQMVSSFKHWKTILHLFKYLICIYRTFCLDFEDFLERFADLFI